MATTSHNQIHNFNDANKSNSTQKSQRPLPTRETDTANYIADMILELRNLSKSADLKTLQGLLEISYYEAFSCANRIAVPAGEEEHLHQLGADARRAVAAGL